MFLSKLVLNLRDRQARFDLARPYDMHRTLWKAFPGMDHGGAGRVLFRVDVGRRDEGRFVLVQSDREPAWTNLPGGYLVCAAESKPFDVQVPSGQRLRFRLRANPTKRVAAKNTGFGGEMAGKRVGLSNEADQLHWLLRKGEKGGGFKIPGHWIEARDPLTGEPRQVPNFRVDVMPEGRDRNKPGCGGEFLAVRFDGVLEVTDPNRFRATVESGIGSAKGYGFGLLSLAPTSVTL